MIDRSVVTKHLKNVFYEHELDENTFCAKFAQLQMMERHISTNFIPSRRHIPMTMNDWKTKLDAFLMFNDADLLQNKGTVTAVIAKQFAESEFEKYFMEAPKDDFEVSFIEENEVKVTVPEIKDKETLLKLKQHSMWQTFNSRCISCGACTIACATCTCFTTTDLIYNENTSIGERRRTAASCQVDGFSDMAGGHAFRPTAGDRMRYKILHKFHDYKARFNDYHMCVGCGRCTSRCPEYISVTATVEKMATAVAEIEVKGDNHE